MRWSFAPSAQAYEMNEEVCACERKNASVRKSGYGDVSRVSKTTNHASFHFLCGVCMDPCFANFGNGMPAICLQLSSTTPNRRVMP